jgi:hypothetical protein
VKSDGANNCHRHHERHSDASHEQYWQQHAKDS